MAPPALQDFEYQFLDNGVRINTTHPSRFIDVVKITGLDSPELRTTFEEYTNQHGGYADTRYFKHRTIVMDGTAYGAVTELQSYLDQLAVNLFPTSEPMPLYYKHPGASQLVVFAKSLGFRYDIETEFGYGRCVFQAQWVAEDPRKYGPLSTAVARLPSAIAPGFGFPIRWPLGFPNQPEYYPALINNAGNFLDGTPALLRIEGPVGIPVIHNASIDKTMRFELTVEAGEELIVDLATRRATLNGKSVRHTLRGGWWLLAAGINEISLSAQNIDPRARLTIEYRPAYI